MIDFTDNSLKIYLNPELPIEDCFLFINKLKEIKKLKSYNNDIESNIIEPNSSLILKSQDNRTQLKVFIKNDRIAFDRNINKLNIQLNPNKNKVTFVLFSNKNGISSSKGTIDLETFVISDEFSFDMFNEIIYIEPIQYQAHIDLRQDILRFSPFKKNSIKSIEEFYSLLMVESQNSKRTFFSNIFYKKNEKTYLNQNYFNFVVIMYILFGKLTANDLNRIKQYNIELIGSINGDIGLIDEENIFKNKGKEFFFNLLKNHNKAIHCVYLVDILAMIRSIDFNINNQLSDIRTLESLHEKLTEITKEVNLIKALKIEDSFTSHQSKLKSIESSTLVTFKVPIKVNELLELASQIKNCSFSYIERTISENGFLIFTFFNETIESCIFFKNNQINEISGLNNKPLDKERETLIINELYKQLKDLNI